MIIGRMLKKDFLRKKLITIVVFAFIFLSALLVASGTNLMIELGNSLDVLFIKANTPHFVQMHTGPLNQAEIDSWTAVNEMVTEQQTVEMITVDGANLYLGESGNSEANSSRCRTATPCWPWRRSFRTSPRSSTSPPRPACAIPWRTPSPTSRAT